MLTHLRFGIPSLDSLFGERDHGILIPRRVKNLPNSGVSVCITGPDGTGKSILGLHLAAHYMLDCVGQQAGECVTPTKVLYVSTDLKFGMASKVWLNFALDWPNRRTVPFTLRQNGDKGLRVQLIPCSPLEGAREEKPLSHYLSTKTSGPAVYFVDLASATAGDDWGYVNRVMSLLTEPADNQPRHLVVIDSVEGFETLVGERDAFGLVRERRSRIAQVMRSAGDKCHALFIVEEPTRDERLPEEFVTDVVIRLRSTPVKNYVRRTLEVEKARGHSHVRGQHSYLIRSGAGSTTGNRENYDDPRVENIHDDDPAESAPERSAQQSYLHVCHSLHHIYRSRMFMEGKGRPAELSERFAAFGIRYLDDMLETKTEPFNRTEGDDQRGLRCSTTTALVGNSETQKSPLGFAFLSRCFRNYAERFSAEIERLGKDPEALRRALDGAGLGEPRRGWLKDNTTRHSEVLGRICRARVDPAHVLGKYAEKGDVDWTSPGVVEIADLARAAAWEVGPPQHPRDGIPVLLTTQDVHAKRLALDFLPWLLRKVPKLRRQEEQHPGCLAALRMLMERYTVCRRLEIHDLPSAVLIHIVQRAIDEAHNILDGNAPAQEAGGRAEQSWGIRVVIDDFSILKDTYIEISEEPLLLRFLVFYLGQEGVTTLLIDTQPGRPDTAVASPLDSELRSLVDHCIYTWRFSFYGENRVAIAVIPPVSSSSPAVVRELRKGIKRGTGPETLPLVVDPHFEMYKGIEKGEPEPIPLEIWIYEELPAFKTYVEQENLRYANLFTPVSADGVNSGKIITSVPGDDYDRLRDLCNLQRDTRLEHTLVFQVDEFWTSPPQGLRRAGTFRPHWKYLNAATAVKKSSEEWEHEWAVDPYRLFQLTSWDKNYANRGDCYCRSKEFACHGYRLDETLGQKAREAVDRVPFMWDFGFLLCKVRHWEESKAKLTFLEESENEEWRGRTVREVWDGLPKGTKRQEGAGGVRPPWRVFLESCYQLAKEQTYKKSEPVVAFDIHVSASQTLACLVLEIWTSEIYRCLPEEGRARLEAQVAERKWGGQTEGLIEWLTKYKRELFKTWLLLIEVLDIQGLSNAVKAGSLRARKPHSASIAVRHWYKTASLVVDNFSLDDPVVPVGLPGHFSVRGDWFLAVAGGSRSGRLADRAIDLLCSRRANYMRLKQGLGLPTRRLVSEELRTRLLTLDYGKDVARDVATERPRRESRVWYDNLIRIGGPLTDWSEYRPEGFHWFWRSGLAHYHRHAGIWLDWLSQTILWWDRMRYVERDKWINGFSRYDEIDRHEKEGTDGEYLDGLEAWWKFDEHCVHLINELKQATLETRTFAQPDY